MHNSFASRPLKYSRHIINCEIRAHEEKSLPKFHLLQESVKYIENGWNGCKAVNFHYVNHRRNESDGCMQVIAKYQ